MTAGIAPLAYWRFALKDWLLNNKVKALSIEGVLKIAKI